MNTHQTARVCVFTPESDRGVCGERSEPQDGSAMPTRGRVPCTRRYRSATTTNYILVLVCSSSGREGNANLSLAHGGCHV